MIGATSSGTRRRGTWRTPARRPVAVAALVIVMLSAGGIFAWRGYGGTTPEPERLTAASLTQAHVAQVSEQLAEKTRDIETTQQQSIDQLQVVQDQLHTVQRLLAAQQEETRKLSEQVGALTSTLDTLRQSFANLPSPDAAALPGHDRAPAAATKGRARTAAQRSRSSTRG